MGLIEVHSNWNTALHSLDPRLPGSLESRLSTTLPGASNINGTITHAMHALAATKINNNIRCGTLILFDLFMYIQHKTCIQPQR